MLGGEIEMCEADETRGTVSEPDDGDAGGPAALWEAVQLKVKPYTEESEKRGELMQVQECLVECMADG